MSLAGPHYHRGGITPWPGQWAIAKQLDGVDVLLRTNAAVLVLRASALDVAATPDEAAQALIDAGLLQLPPDRGIAQVGTEATSGRTTMWHEQVLQALTSRGWGGRVAVGGWSVGWPAESAIAGCPIHFADALAFGGLYSQYPGRVVLCMDEYVSILPDDPLWGEWVNWTGARHTLVAACLARHNQAIPLVTLESGADACQPSLATPETGDWHSRGWTAAQYLGAMAALDALDRTTPGYLGRCYYTVGAQNEWARFNVDSLQGSGVLAGAAIPPSGPPPVPPVEVTMSSWYCTEIGPDGSGHNRCGPACIAYALLRAGWASDPWGLTLEVTGKAMGLTQPPPASFDLGGGMTAAQVAAMLVSYGRPAAVVASVSDLLAAARAGAVTLWLVDNWYLRPRSYPAGASWDALHWVAIHSFVDADTVVLNDPLTYDQGEYPQPYQGYTTCTVASLMQAVYATDPSLPAGVRVG